MKTLVKLISVVALLASMPGSESVAQQMVSKMKGQAEKQPAAPLYPRFHQPNDQNGAVLGGTQQGGTQDPVRWVIVDHLRPEPAGNLSDDIVIVPGAPFVVFAGPKQSNALLLLDAGIVPEAGLRVLTLAPDVALGDEMSIYFESDGVIICLAGRDANPDMPSVDQVALVGPGASGLQLGHGAALVAGDLSHDLSGEILGSDDRGSGSGTGERRRPADDDRGIVTAAGTSAQGQAAP